jgi:gluconate kinase
MYIIIKHVKIRESMKLPVIMLDSQCEVLEYNNKDKTQEMVNILNTNSDSGHK